MMTTERIYPSQVPDFHAQEFLPPGYWDVELYGVYDSGPGGSELLITMHYEFVFDVGWGADVEDLGVLVIRPEVPWRVAEDTYPFYSLWLYDDRERSFGTEIGTYTKLTKAFKAAKKHACKIREDFGVTP